MTQASFVIWSRALNRLKSQYRFLKEADRLKSVFRKSRPFCDSDRYENSAEHSWHVCVMALILGEYSNEPIDMLRVIKMLVVHDLVEIDTSDKMVYFKHKEDEEKENKAAERLFGMLPGDQRDDFMGLWREYNSKETPEAKFANALDKMQAATQNMEHGCVDWTDFDIKYDDVVRVNRIIENGSRTLWEDVKSRLDQCKREGLIE